MHGFRLASCALPIALFATGLQGYGQTNSPSRENLDLQAARGNISRVTSLDNPAQSYALYLPPNYSPDREWPILYVFDPFARGEAAVEVYKGAAEKYGYVVAGSNNSKNGPTAEELAAAQALWLDTHRRLAIDKRRVYTSGLSGGARVATSFALYCYTCAIAGVIAHGAGYPVMQNPKQPVNDHFFYYAAIGDSDFNFPEIMALRKKKEDGNAPCKVKIYPGPHQWAPPEIAEDAIAWMEVKSMQAGIEKPDAAFVKKMFEQTQTEATQAEQRGDVLTEYYALRSLVYDFQGLEDTTAAADKLAQVKGSKALSAAEHKLQRDIEEQTNLAGTVPQELVEFGAPDVSASNSGQMDAPDPKTNLGRHIEAVMSDLRRKAKSTASDHLVYARAFTQLWIQALEAGQQAMRDKKLALARAYFELLADISPDQPLPMVFVAEARVREGNKKAALKAIEQAVHRGLKHAEILTQDPELQPLASDPEFQRIVQSLGAQ